MTRKLGTVPTGLLMAGFAVALGFGATQAFAGVADVQPRDRCANYCIARFNACLSIGGSNCIAEQRDCLESCSI